MTKMCGDSWASPLATADAEGRETSATSQAETRRRACWREVREAG